MIELAISLAGLAAVVGFYWWVGTWTLCRDAGHFDRDRPERPC